MKPSTNPTQIIADSTIIGAGTEVGSFIVIGSIGSPDKPVQIGSDCRIGNHVTISPGVKIGNGVTIGDQCYIDREATLSNDIQLDTHTFIGKKTEIGKGSLILYGARVYDGTSIGENCRIGGFVAENAIIGKNVTMFGSVIHSFRDPRYWRSGEKTARIEDFVVAAFGTLIIGGITVGHHSYLAAGSIVSKDVPPKSVAIDVNRFIPNTEWKGELKKSPLWRWNI